MTLFKPSVHVSEALFTHLVDTHTLGHDGFHGKDHWLRVLRNGRELEAHTGANLRVVELFALLNDVSGSMKVAILSMGIVLLNMPSHSRGVWFVLSSHALELSIMGCKFKAST